MSNAYKIDTKKTGIYVNRELEKMLKTLKIVFAVILAGFLFLSIITKIYYMILIALVVFTLVYLYVSAILKGDLKALVKTFKIEFDDTSVSREVNIDTLPPFQKIRAERAKSRYGTMFSERIDIDEIQSTTINENEIIIKSANFNPINNNGIIKIPVEIEYFDKIIGIINSSPEKFKLNAK